LTVRIEAVKHGAVIVCEEVQEGGEGCDMECVWDIQLVQCVDEGLDECDYVVDGAVR
jgi:hypothetical protein